MNPFVGEIRMMSFNFPPRGWALCNGQILPIAQNQALFSLLGTAFGGNGTQNFGLPNLQGRVPVHVGGAIGAALGGSGGEESHTLVTGEMPSHNHVLMGVSTTGTVAAPAGAFLAGATSALYGAAAALGAMDQSSVSNAGGGQPHENRSPYLTVSFCIALAGIYPSRS